MNHKENSGRIQEYWNSAKNYLYTRPGYFYAASGGLLTESINFALEGKLGRSMLAAGAAFYFGNKASRVNSLHEHDIFNNGILAEPFEAQLSEMNNFIDNNPHPKPLYESLDGETKINDPKVLLRSTGSPSQAVMRAELIVGHASQRELNVDEIEELRRIKSAMNLLPVTNSELCRAGQGLMARIKEITASHEENKKVKSFK